MIICLDFVWRQPTVRRIFAVRLALLRQGRRLTLPVRSLPRATRRVVVRRVELRLVQAPVQPQGQRCERSQALRPSPHQLLLLESVQVPQV
jgi:hypothetical protein